MLPRQRQQRILRYLAKLTINPARTHGIGHVVGSLAPGRLADIVLWPIAIFGVKPKLIVKGGMIAWALMGDPNASIPTPEPVHLSAHVRSPRRGARRHLRHLRVPLGVRGGRRTSSWACDAIVEPVRDCRSVSKADMVRNDATPVIEVDPETYEVRLDGELATVPPAETLPMSQLYFLV